YHSRIGILSMILCFALGIANIVSSLFTLRIVITIFAVLCLVSGFIIVFVEIPLLLRICPTSSGFDAAIRRVSTNYMRAGAYGVMGALQFISIVGGATSLVAAAVFLTITAICYLLAGLKGQAFVGSKTLGGAGVAQMIV
ncbi:TVP18/Calcium channel flower, partial [Rhypophila sp. PSN 637]